MFHNRTLNIKINKLHERALRITYKDEKLAFYELLENDISSPIVSEIFNVCPSTYNIRAEKLWEIENVRTTIYGTETISFRHILFDFQFQKEVLPPHIV